MRIPEPELTSTMVLGLDSTAVRMKEMCIRDSRNVAPLPHGNAQIGLRQHRTVVDAIPDHCDTATMAANRRCV